MTGNYSEGIYIWNPVNTDISVGRDLIVKGGSNDEVSSSYAYGIRLNSVGEDTKQNISVDGKVSVDSSADATGVSISSTSGGTVNVTIGGGITASAKDKDSKAVDLKNVAGTVNLDVTGDVKADDIGINVQSINSNSAMADIVVDGTIRAENAGVQVTEEVTEDNLKLTVWKIDLNEKGNAVEVGEIEPVERPQAFYAPANATLGNTNNQVPAEIDQQTEDSKEALRTAVEKNIMYIIKVEQPTAGATLTATGENGAALAKSHDFDVAKEGENVYLKVDLQDGYKLTGAFNGLGEKVALVLDGKSGNYYVSVPKGGGVYLSAVLEKLPDPEPDPTPDPQPDPTPDRKSTGFGGGSDGEDKPLPLGRWAMNENGRYFVFSLGGSAKNMILNIDAASSGTYTPGYYGFGEDGYMLKGWATINGYKYYFDPDTGLMQTGWVKIDGVEYYLNQSANADFPYGSLLY